MRIQTAVVVLASLIAASPVVAAAQPPAIGQSVPGFSLTDSHGQVRSLDEFRGRFIVLEWFNPECPFVRKHYSSGRMQQLQKAAVNRGAIWLSIDSSAPGKQGNLTPEKAVTFAQDQGMGSTAVLLDPDGKVGRLYDAKTTPHMFIIAPDGKLIYDGAIDDKPSTDVKDFETAINYVQQALDEAIDGRPVTTSLTQPYGCGVKY